MGSATAQLIAEFEFLPEPDKQVFVKEILRRLPLLDSGPLDDEEIALAGDALAALLE